MGGEVDVAAVVSDEDVFVSATGFHRQLTAPIVSSLPQLRRSPRLRPLAASASALITPPPTYYPAPSDLNLDGAGKPLTFSSAIRGPHGKEWGLGDRSSSSSWSPSSAYLPSSAPPRPPPIFRE